MYDDWAFRLQTFFASSFLFLWMVDCDACIEVPNEEASKMCAY